MPLTVKTHIDELIVEVPRAHTLFDRAMWIGILISGCVFVFALLWRPPEGAPPPQTPWILSSPERCEGPMIPDACGEELIALWRVPSRDEVILALERGRLHTHFPAAFPTQERLPALPRAWGELEPGDQRLVQQILRDRPPTDHPALHHSPWLIASYLDPGGAPPPVALTTPSDVDLTALVEAKIIGLRDGVPRLSPSHPDGRWIFARIQDDLARYTALLERSRARALETIQDEARFEHALDLRIHAEALARGEVTHRRHKLQLGTLALAWGLVLCGLVWRRRLRTAALVVSQHALTVDGTRLLWEDLCSVLIDPDRIRWEHSDGRIGELEGLRFTSEAAGTLLQVFDHRLNHPREPRDPQLEAQLEALVSGR